MEKIPKYTPYLLNSWDRMDEYHTLSSEISEKEFATFFAVVFKRGKVKNLQDALNLPEFEFGYITRSTRGNLGSWQVDLYGGMFNVYGMYLSSDFYMPWFDREVLKGKDTIQKRYDYIVSLILKYYE